MANAETYFYGQGKLYERSYKDGKTWRWLMDVSELNIQLEVEKVEHRESFSGQRALARSIIIDKNARINATLHSLSPENIALSLYGKPLNINGGNVTGEQLPNGLKQGDIVTLEHPKVSNLVITDSASTPVTLDPEHYRLNADHGSLEILSLPTTPPTQPFVVSYDHGETRQVAMFTAPQPEIELRYEGINLAEGGAPVIVELYRVATDPLQELALISTDTSVAGMAISGSILLDSGKPANGDLGQFGRIIQVA